jgi:hypothetical protein
MWFQDTYCRVLVRYKEELLRPLDDAASFLNSIQAQLSNLCSGSSSPPATATHSGKKKKLNHRTLTFLHVNCVVHRARTLTFLHVNCVVHRARTHTFLHVSCCHASGTALHTGSVNELAFCFGAGSIKFFLHKARLGGKCSCACVCVCSLKGQIVSMQMGCRAVRGGVKHWEDACVGFVQGFVSVLCLTSLSLHIGFSSLACVMELEIPGVGSELA